MTNGSMENEFIIFGLQISQKSFRDLNRATGRWLERATADVGEDLADGWSLLGESMADGVDALIAGKALTMRKRAVTLILNRAARRLSNVALTKGLNKWIEVYRQLGFAESLRQHYHMNALERALSRWEHEATVRRRHISVLGMQLGCASRVFRTWACSARRLSARRQLEPRCALAVEYGALERTSLAGRRLPRLWKAWTLRSRAGRELGERVRRCQSQMARRQLVRGVASFALARRHRMHARRWLEWTLFRALETSWATWLARLLHHQERRALTRVHSEVLSKVRHRMPPAPARLTAPSGSSTDAPPTPDAGTPLQARHCRRLEQGLTTWLGHQLHEHELRERRWRHRRQARRHRLGSAWRVWRREGRLHRQRQRAVCQHIEWMSRVEGQLTRAERRALRRGWGAWTRAWMSSCRRGRRERQRTRRRSCEHTGELADGRGSPLLSERLPALRQCLPVRRQPDNYLARPRPRRSFRRAELGWVAGMARGPVVAGVAAGGAMSGPVSGAVGDDYLRRTARARLQRGWATWHLAWRRYAAACECTPPIATRTFGALHGHLDLGAPSVASRLAPLRLDGSSIGASPPWPRPRRRLNLSSPIGRQLDEIGFDVVETPSTEALLHELKSEIPQLVKAELQQAAAALINLETPPQLRKKLQEQSSPFLQRQMTWLKQAERLLDLLAEAREEGDEGDEGDEASELDRSSEAAEEAPMLPSPVSPSPSFARRLRSGQRAPLRASRTRSDGEQASAGTHLEARTSSRRPTNEEAATGAPHDASESACQSPAEANPPTAGIGQRGRQSSFQRARKVVKRSASAVSSASSEVLSRATSGVTSGVTSGLSVGIDYLHYLSPSGNKAPSNREAMERAAAWRSRRQLQQPSSSPSAATEPDSKPKIWNSELMLWQRTGHLGPSEDSRAAEEGMAV